MSKNFSWNPGQQRAVDGVLASDARYILLYGGSRSGKTLLFTSSVFLRAMSAPRSRHLIVRQEGTSAKRAIVKGTVPDLYELRWPDVAKPVWKDQLGYFELANGSEIWIGGLNDEKALDKILGNEYATIYANEASEITYKAFTLLRSRLAQNAAHADGEPLRQRMYIDLNPTTRMHWTYRLWVDGIDPEDETAVNGDQYAADVINPADNAANLTGDYLADLSALPERARRRFLEGKYVEDVEQALWRRALFKRVENLPEFQRIVVAIDPAVSTSAGSDETGIICAAIDGAGVGYVLEDASGRYKPEEWAKQAVAMYDIWGADRVVGEKNQGGDMVESVLRAHRADVPYTGVTATRGKFVRAEPVAALYERGKIFHAGRFEDLEGQMCSFTTDFDRKKQGWSPDRVDALVWAFTDLFPQMTRRAGRHGTIAPRRIGTMA